MLMCISAQGGISIDVSSDLPWNKVLLFFTFESRFFLVTQRKYVRAYTNYKLMTDQNDCQYVSIVFSVCDLL